MVTAARHVACTMVAAQALGLPRSCIGCANKRDTPALSFVAAGENAARARLRQTNDVDKGIV